MASQGNVYSDVGRGSHTSTGDDKAVGTIESAAAELKSKLRHAAETGRTRLSEWESGFEAGVREKPIQSLLIAAAVGTVIGLLLGRRNHH
jgi:ElaB/YqjD/DUF883 family membrane-anchored ribosome-binding protein